MVGPIRLTPRWPAPWACRSPPTPPPHDVTWRATCSPLGGCPTRAAADEGHARRRGNTLIWFTEANADRDRPAPRHARRPKPPPPDALHCGCGSPVGLALDPAGDVWFTEGVSNRLGRISPDPGPSTPRGTAAPLHHPELHAGRRGQSRLCLVRSPPHSLTIDRRGLVLVHRDRDRQDRRPRPGRSRPGTTDGIDGDRAAEGRAPPPTRPTSSWTAPGRCTGPTEYDRYRRLRGSGGLPRSAVHGRVT